TTTIDRGATLTLSNNLIVQTTAQPGTTAGTQTGAQVAIKSTTRGTGALGALNVGGGNVIVTGYTFSAAKPAGTQDSIGVLDLSGLDSFTYTNTTNGVLGVGTSPSGSAATDGV